MRHSTFRLIVTVAVMVSVVGCERDSGLSGSIARHFAREGISIEPIRVEQTAWSRSGYVIAKHSPDDVKKIVETFHLRQVTNDSNDALHLKLVFNQSDAKLPQWIEAWGLRDRPAEFRLQDGGQFEYFYLVVTNEGQMILLASYAYG